MSVPNLKSFREALEKVPGLEHSFESDQPDRNVSGLRREIAARVSVNSPSDVRAVVEQAREFKVPLYPVSRGMNWGYGSFLPVEDHCVLLDLGNLRVIRNRGEIGTENPVAVIEPGVSQGSLHEAIDSKGLFFNATGAGPNTSVIGNSLERGFGYCGLRPDDILALEVVLGTGEIIRTGFWGVKNASGALRYPSCLGPSPEGLFYQSNFGIVTAAAIRLREKPGAHAAMLVALEDEKEFPGFFDALAGLRRRRVFDSVMHVGNARRARSTLGPAMFEAMDEPANPAERRARVESHLDTLPYRAWSGVTAIQGTEAVVESAFREARDILGDIASVERIDEDSLARLADDTSMESRVALQSKRQLLELTRGVPVESPLWSPYWALGMERPGNASGLDETDAGILFCAPVLPLDGAAASDAVALLESTLQRHGFDAYITLNLASESSLLCIANIVFDRRDDVRVREAHDAIASTYRVMIEAGHYPYRLGIQSMDLAAEGMGESFAVAKALKRVFDPDGILAPGRYGLY